ncbi:RAS guanyl-releasing protein 4 isoform X2 [Pelobates fuscus]|uniref:RAS guanyl-releasing protein 4 isoform X2 n=2 Tax=Pelobates fuscus TaxID=191477 RepID=UPI002FE4A384
MNRKDSKRKSRLDLSNQTLSSNGVFITIKGRPRRSRRRMTCPSPAEINKAMVSVTLAPLGKGCTLEELLEKCIQSFDLEGNLWRNEDTVHMTLVMHSWVVPSDEFAQKILQLYKAASQNHTRIAICHFARFWISNYPEMFRLDRKLEEAMSDLWEVMKEDHGKSHHRAFGTSHMLEQEATRKIQESPSFNKKRKVSLLFDHLEPSELADHLSYLDFKCFCRISHLDYRSYTLQNSLRDIPHLERSVNLCNSISQWVQIMVLNRPTPQQRAEVFHKFIQVTQKLRKLQNFNTLMAVIGGLCHSAISRMKETHSHLSQDVLKTLSEMTELLSSSSNYSTYRRVYNECAGFKIPILGVQLKDLVSLNEALPDFLANGKINVSKLHSLYQHILELRQLQKGSPPFKTNKDVILLLTSSLDLFHTEDEIYSLSYTREPRSPKVMSSVPYKPSSETTQWTSEVPLHQDPETLSHNVTQMVESVFQFYDPEHKGYVSTEDFDKIVVSLPFSCHILEKESDGPINRQEMTSYFMKASHVCSKLGVRFLQSVVEARLKKSPLCANCVWAVAKQGNGCGGLDHEVIQSWAFQRTNPEKHNLETWGPHSRTMCLKATQTEGPTKEQPAALQHMATGDSDHRKQLCRDPCWTSPELLAQIKELQEERDRLLLENAGLHCSNSQMSAENARLQSQLYSLQQDLRKLSLDSVTQAAILQILQSINALQLQCDGES